MRTTSLMVAGLMSAGLVLTGCGMAATGNTGAASKSMPASSASMAPSAMTPSASVSGTPSAGYVMPSGSMTPAASGSMTMTPMAVKTGAYLSYQDYQQQMADRAGTTTVLFFHAPWCPDCRGTDKSLTSAGTPDGLTVVKVDFDSATELRQTYGVTVQHTFVVIDAAGKEIKKFTGAKTGANIAERATS